jgi:hypothetical protein
VAEIEEAVGEGGANRPHDVALVQGILRVVSDGNGRPYLTGAIDGRFDQKLKAAIGQFQRDQSLLVNEATSSVRLREPMGGKQPSGPRLSSSFAEDLATVKPASPTLQRMSERLVAPFDRIRSVRDSSIVYLGATADEATAGLQTLLGVQNMEPVFLLQVQNAARQLYADTGLSVRVTSDGKRRSFEEQANIVRTRPGATRVGPGESNHNYGRAVDLIFKGFRWIKDDGSAVLDDTAESLETAKGTRVADLLWNARDAAFVGIGLYVIPVSKTFRDRPHVQSFSHTAVNMGNALAALLKSLWVPRWTSGSRELRSTQLTWSHR